MGDDDAPTGPAPSFGGDADGDDNDRGVLAALGPLAGLSAQKAVQDQIQSVATQAKSVEEQRADIMAHFKIAEGEEADDGADIEDETAELWDPEAEDDGNVFAGHTSSVAKSGVELDEGEEPLEVSEVYQEEVEEPVAASFDEDESDDDRFAVYAESEDAPEAAMPVEESVEAEEAAEAVEAKAPVSIADVVPMPTRQAQPAKPRRVRREVRSRAAPGSKEKAAFTLRLDKSRHLKLRLASAVTGRSAQKMLIEALDRMLEEMPEIDALAERAPEAGKKAG
nr:hypothetical protein [Sphingomicrobium lutaoense]